ncbi:hypothetical protein [Planctellipticum variicoloris]|uniref:hypothetical protein n=1 Tax=Planctellipticum variicoloris TaxID=3064265 RepID=UPI002BFE5658|nr:hypothetical protein SH412_000846 [Planctomycetaceae bacterium SH412]HTN01897.1 hypothetical protein [Planctomycetaceae bacterium]
MVRCPSAWLASSLVILLAAGCGGPSGPERAIVKGTVAFDGAPVESGTIAFLPVDGTEGPSSGGEIRDGEFLLPKESGAVVGQNRVEIRATRQNGKPVANGIAGVSEGPSAASSEAKVVMYIPPQYNVNSELKETIKAGENSLSFDLHSSK